MTGAPASGVCVAVPARNEQAALPRVLDALLCQTRLADEVVVCDAGSTDRSREVVRSYAARGVRLIEGGPAYPGRARNLAVQAARHPWVALVDCGCVPEPGWLAALLAVRDANAEIDVVYGDYDPFVAGPWDVAQALVVLSPRDPATGCRPPSTASMLVRRSLFATLGGFPEHLRAAEDLRFFEAIARSGVRVAHAPDARVRWTLAASPAAVFRRLRLYAAHHAAAGLARTWHHRVFAMDAIAAVLLLAGFAWPVAWVALATGGVARLLRTVTRRRASAPPEARALGPGSLARASVLIVLADAACLLGYLDFRRGRLAQAAE